MERKHLIGLAATHNSGERECAEHLADAFGLRLWHMQQPIIDAVAGLTGLAPHQLAHAPPTAELPMLKTRLGELTERLHITTRLLNADYLPAHLQDRMLNQAGSFLFSGDLVAGIRTPAEAYWLRAQGGHLVHLINPDSPRSEVPVDGDRDTVALQRSEPTAAELKALANAVRATLRDAEAA